jgi:hypothetical protein
MEIGPALSGGALIGIAAAALLVTTGKTAGVSGILEGVVGRKKGEAGWKVAFLLGLLAGARPDLARAAGLFRDGRSL